MRRNEEKNVHHSMAYHAFLVINLEITLINLYFYWSIRSIHDLYIHVTLHMIKSAYLFDIFVCDQILNVFQIVRELEKSTVP